MARTPTFKPVKSLLLAILAVCLGARLVSAGAPGRIGRPAQASASPAARLGGSEQTEETGRADSQANPGVSKPTKSSVTLSCSVVDWKATSLKPVLTLACPGDEARIRVYLKLSWLDAQDRPENYQDIVAPSGAAAKLHSDADGAIVLLKFRQAGKEEPRPIWISFNELVSLEVQQRD